MSNFGFISKKKVAREIEEIYREHSTIAKSKDMFFFDNGACSALNLLCDKLSIVPMHRNKLGGGTGEALRR